LRNIYGQPDIIKEIKRLGHVARMEEKRMVKRVVKGHIGG
jgi:hypothetical protein